VKLDAIRRGGDCAGVAHGAELIAFAEALVAHDEPALATARAALVGAMGAAATVDAAGVASNFERMVRIADGTGITLDGPMARASDELRAELGLQEFWDNKSSFE
jgi:hypothetical protein